MHIYYCIFLSRGTIGTGELMDRGCHLATFELSQISCIQLYRPFRKKFHPDLETSENRETVFANFFLWLSASLLIVHCYIWFLYCYLIFFLGGARKHLVAPDIFLSLKQLIDYNQVNFILFMCKYIVLPSNEECQGELSRLQILKFSNWL